MDSTNHMWKNFNKKWHTCQVRDGTTCIIIVVEIVCYNRGQEYFRNTK
jgi:hypothetical protein